MTAELRDFGDQQPPFALTVDVEEWYHSCLVPDYVHPDRRPSGLVRELDSLLPSVLDLLASARATATFFVLAEVAVELPERIRELVAAGHEVASHSFHHLRVNELSVAEFRLAAERSKKLLEDLTGSPVQGFRAPEWSMRKRGNPRLGVLAQLGYEYDSSLAPFLGAGSLANSRVHSWLEAEDLGLESGAPNRLLELPPLSFGGPLRLPAGSWTGRRAPLPWILSAGDRLRSRGGVPVLVVHPWELSARPTPGRLPGFAGFVHEFGRLGYRERFERLLQSRAMRSISQAFGGLSR